MIPKIIHQVWKDERIPTKWHAWHESWKRHFPSPEFTHMLWTDRAARDLVSREYPDFLDIYDGYPRDIQRADAIRYMLLHHFGGIYADLDCECHARFYENLETWPGNKNIFIVTNRPPATGDLAQNSLMASVAAHGFWLHVIEHMRTASAKPPRLPHEPDVLVLETTGPRLLQEAFLDAQTDDIALLPKYQYNLERCREGVPRLILKNLLSPAPTIFVLHHYSGSWKESRPGWIHRAVPAVRRAFGDRFLAAAGLVLLTLVALRVWTWLR